MTLNFLSIPVYTDFNLDQVLLILSCLALLFICCKIIVSSNLLDSIIAMSALSLIVGVIYLLMDAPDVTMTEVALGSALSTCVMLNMLSKVGEGINHQGHRNILAILLCVIFTIILMPLVFELPTFGDETSPLHQNVTKYYVENTYRDIQIPSMVAAVLASYRGFDTFGETVVILIAGIAVLFISARKRSKC